MDPPFMVELHYSPLLYYKIYLVVKEKSGRAIQAVDKGTLKKTLFRQVAIIGLIIQGRKYSPVCDKLLDNSGNK